MAKRTSGTTRRYWLFKSEPSSFSIQDLAASPGRRTGWDGVRNYQARNHLRDDVKPGDGVLFHHSSADPPAIAGIAKVVGGGRPDPTALDKADPHYDPKSTVENPVWFLVDVELERVFDPPLTLQEMRAVPALSEMVLLQKGSRLSIQPVTAREWAAIGKLRPA